MGVDRETVRKWINSGLVERVGSRAQVDLGLSVRAVFAHLREIAAGRSSGDDTLNLVAERARESKERADKLALENA